MNFDLSNSSVSRKEVKEKKVDMINFERRQRQFLNELAMKRNQVEELRKERDAANLKIHELTRALDTAKNTNEDHQYNLNLAITNARFFEDQLQAKRDFVTKTRLQQESAVAERESLRALLQKSEIQNHNLNQELNELKAQHNCDVAYQKELMNEDAKIREKIAQVTKAFEELQLDQNEVVQLSSKIQENQVLQNSVTFYQTEFFKCKQNYNKLEEKFIVVNAAMEKFEKLANANNELFHPNQESELIIDQWKKSTVWANDQKSIQNEIIQGLSESLKLETESNMKLYIRESELETREKQLEEEVHDLRIKLDQFIKEKQEIAVQTDEDVVKTIKTEVIEIIDY